MVAVSDVHPKFWAPRALVVGGGRGVGRQVVCQLATSNAPCAFVYKGDDVAAQQTVELAQDLGRSPIAIRGDIGRQAGELVGRAIDDLNGLDLLVFTAVPHLLGRVLDVSHDDFQLAMDVVVWGVQQAVLAASDALADGGGSVVVLSSLGAQRYAKYYGVLGPAKAALEGLVRYLAAELGPRSIRVNGLSASLIYDSHSEPDSEVAQHYEAIARRTPLRRLVTSADVATSALALGSPDFSFVTGQMLTIDGGYGLLA